MDQYQFHEYVNANYGHPSLQDFDDYCRRLTSVRFSSDKQGMCKLGKVILHDDFEGTVSEGDVWFCELSNMSNRCYIGRPVQKVDAEFMAGLSKDQMQDVADAVWKNSKDAVVPYLEKWFIDEKGLMSVEEHREDLQALKDMYGTEISELKGSHAAELEERDKDTESLRREYEAMLADLEKEKEAAMAAIDSLNNEILGLRRELETARSQPARVEVKVSPDAMMRTGETTIGMPSMADGPYEVLVSADGSKMIVSPDPRGKAVCESGTMYLRGLDRVAPFTGVAELPYTYDGRTGTYSVDLGGRAPA